MATDSHNELDDALTALDFNRAREAIAGASTDAQPELLRRYEAAHEDAERRAEQLAGRIQSMARADHYEGLLALGQDATTGPLLDLLSSEIRRGAALHLDGAERRQHRFQAGAKKHMDEASEALVLLDINKARSELSRIDKRWLDEEQRSTLEQLEHQANEAAAERREFDARTADVLRDHHPSQKPARSGNRAAKSTRRGCATSIVATVVVSAVIAGLAL